PSRLRPATPRAAQCPICSFWFPRLSKPAVSPAGTVSLDKQAASTCVLRAVECGSCAKAIASAEDPADDHDADEQEPKRHAEAYGDRDIGNAEESPAKTAHQIDDRVEQGDRAPDAGQHVDRIEGAPKEGKGRHHQQRHKLQLLKIPRPDSYDEAEQR